MTPSAAPWRASPRIFSESLAPVDPPLAALLRRGGSATPAAVAARAARALLDLPEVAEGEETWPSWLTPHQVPAARRLRAIIERYGGAVLADAVGLGKSYVALAVALTRREPFALVVPAVLVPQWRALLQALGGDAPVVTHESLSRSPVRLRLSPSAPVRLFVVDEAHRFRDPHTNRYHALAKLVVGARVLLVTATPVHNRLGDLLHLLRLFLRDHALTALGLPSLRRATQEEVSRETLAAVMPRLVVARSRDRVRRGYAGGPVALVFPTRERGETLRAGVAPDADLARWVAVVARLHAGGPAAALCRVTLLRRLASSTAAFRRSLARYAAFLDMAADAARAGRALTSGDFARLVPREESDDVQLALLPLLLPPGKPVVADDRALLEMLRADTAGRADPKAEALEALLAARDGKTIVFADAVATVRYLARRLARRRRVAAVAGETGWLGIEPASRTEVLRTFAPQALGAPRPGPALVTDVLVATDLVSEGLNLQDADRVVHYDLPWSPARLAQRVGRIDRLGSRHGRIETVTFLPPEPLAQALAAEQRLAAKLRIQQAAGTAQLEPVGRHAPTAAAFDWCDRLDLMQQSVGAVAPAGAIAAIGGDRPVVVLIVRIGGLTEGVVVSQHEARTDPETATRVLEEAATAAPHGEVAGELERAVEQAAPLIRARLAAIEDARWRSTDRDRLARRLIPWVLSAARRAARRGDASGLAALDALVSRLTHGMTAGEELLLEDLLARREAFAIDDLLSWHRRLQPVDEQDAMPGAELVAAVVVTPAFSADPGAGGYLPACPSPLSSSTSTGR